MSYSKRTVGLFMLGTVTALVGGPSFSLVCR